MSTEHATFVAELAGPLAVLVRDGESLHALVVDGEGVIVRANAAFERLVGRAPIGQLLDGFLVGASAALLADHLAHDRTSSLLVQVASGSGEPASLNVFAQRLATGFALVGEPPWSAHLDLSEQVLQLNAELALLSRERARQARLLDEAQTELKDSHWLLKKASAVLPICMACRNVKTGEDTWQSVAEYLERNSTFLSHGYCATCAAKLEAESKE